MKTLLNGLLGRNSMPERKCARCGKIQTVDTKSTPRPVIGTRAKANNCIFQCSDSDCGIFVCGACAWPKFDLYIRQGVPQEMLDKATAIQTAGWIRGEEAQEIIEKVYQATGGNLVISYRCPRCGAEVGM